MKKRIFSVLAIMCSMMLMMTGCGGANETDVNDGGINAVDNTMKFSELFENDVIAYFNSATRARAVSASSFLPSFISCPIVRERELTSARFLSN